LINSKEDKMVTLESVQKNTEVEALILGAQKQLDGLGYTEHSHRHISIVSKRAGDILEKLGYPERTVELARIAGYLHDIGNCVNRTDHAHSGVIMAFNILKDMGMPVEERTEIMMAIGNHDESTGTAVSEISAALILADKSDVHRNRVTNTNLSTFDIHDRVNYAVTNAQLDLNSEERKIILNLTMDTKLCPVLDYFEIFMNRTMMSKYAAKYLKVWFELVINGTKLL
jgi:metal dependent phosphohydrolase